MHTMPPASVMAAERELDQDQDQDQDQDREAEAGRDLGRVDVRLLDTPDGPQYQVTVIPTEGEPHPPTVTPEPARALRAVEAGLAQLAGRGAQAEEQAFEAGYRAAAPEDLA